MAPTHYIILELVYIDHIDQELLDKLTIWESSSDLGLKPALLLSRNYSYSSGTKPAALPQSIVAEKRCTAKRYHCTVSDLNVLCSKYTHYVRTMYMYVLLPFWHTFLKYFTYVAISHSTIVLCTKGCLWVIANI